MNEQLSNIYIGLLMHFGSTLLYIFLLLFVDLTLFNVILYFFVAGLPFMLGVLILEHMYPIVELPLIKVNDMYEHVKDTFVYAIVIGFMLIASMHNVLEYIFGLTNSNSIMGVIMTIVLTDLTYYVIHRWTYHKKYYTKYFYNLHLPHHQLENLDFIRGNHSSFLDLAVMSFQLWCSIYAYIFGLNLQYAIIAYSIIMLTQVVHHANYTFDIGSLRYLFIDSHTHKLHHCIGGQNINFGGTLSVWDLLFGTYYENHKICANYVHLIKKHYLSAVS